MRFEGTVNKTHRHAHINAHAHTRAYLNKKSNVQYHQFCAKNIKKLSVTCLPGIKNIREPLGVIANTCHIQ